MNVIGLPSWLSGKESHLPMQETRLQSRSGKVPHAVEQPGPCTAAIESGL